jgi:uncharacterized protein (TIGR02266 family)
MIGPRGGGCQRLAAPGQGSKRRLDTPAAGRVCCRAMSEELRRHPRQPIQVDFRAREAAGSGLLLFEGVDLSAGGAFLRSDILLEQGEVLVVEFRVPGVPRLMKSQARVAWVRRFPADGEAPGMGVQFLALPEEDRKALESYLRGGA